MVTTEENLAGPSVVVPEVTAQAAVVETPVAQAEITSPPAAEVTVPEPITPAVPETPLPIDPRVQQELDVLHQQMSRERTQLAQREAQLLEQENQRGFQSAVAQLQRELEEQDGLTPERAQVRAQREIGAAWQAYNAEQNARRQMVGIVRHVQLAAELSDRHKIPITSLLQYPTTEAMQDAVGRVAAQNAQAARIAQLEAQVAKLTKGTVPPQSYATGAGPVAGNPSLEALAAKDTRHMTLAQLEEHDRLLDAAIKRGR